MIPKFIFNNKILPHVYAYFLTNNLYNTVIFLYVVITKKTLITKYFKTNFNEILQELKRNII